MAAGGARPGGPGLARPAADVRRARRPDRRSRPLPRRARARLPHRARRSSPATSPGRTTSASTCATATSTSRRWSAATAPGWRRSTSTTATSRRSCVYLLTDARTRALVYHAEFAPTRRRDPRPAARPGGADPGRRRVRQRHCCPARSTTRPCRRDAGAGGRAARARPATTSTSSTPAAPPACPRACCGATTTSTSPRWAARRSAPTEPFASYDAIARGRQGRRRRHAAADDPAVHARRRAVVDLPHDHRRRHDRAARRGPHAGCRATR